MRLSRMASTEVSRHEFNVDLDEIEALNQKRTLAFINHWVYHTVQFLNQFSKICQDKLFSLENKLRRASDALSILEFKLSSIPGLDDVSVVPSTHSNHIPQPLGEVVSAEPPSFQERELNSVADRALAQDSEEPLSEGKKQIPISSHPQYASYFKMVNFGVPKEAVKLKMAACGLDPSLLDDPSSLVEDAKDKDKESSSSFED